MRKVNMHEAKTHLSRLVERAARGEGFIIAKAGKPLVKVVPLSSREETAPRRLGFLGADLREPPLFDCDLLRLPGQRPLLLREGPRLFRLMRLIRGRDNAARQSQHHHHRRRQRKPLTAYKLSHAIPSPVAFRLNGQTLPVAPDVLGQNFDRRIAPRRLPADMTPKSLPDQREHAVALHRSGLGGRPKDSNRGNGGRRSQGRRSEQKRG